MKERTPKKMIISEFIETKTFRVVPFALKKALMTPKTFIKMGVNKLIPNKYSKKTISISLERYISIKNVSKKQITDRIVKNLFINLTPYYVTIFN